MHCILTGFCIASVHSQLLPLCQCPWLNSQSTRVLRSEFIVKLMEWVWSQFGGYLMGITCQMMWYIMKLICTSAQLPGHILECMSVEGPTKQALSVELSTLLYIVSKVLYNSWMHVHADQVICVTWMSCLLHLINIYTYLTEVTIAAFLDHCLSSPSIVWIH